MKRFLMWRPWTLAPWIVLTLVGCGGGLSGKYVSSDGITAMALDFQGGDKVIVDEMGNHVEGSYKLDGDKVTVYVNGRNMILTVAGDSLTGGPMGMSFKKQ